jgi:hypothetical protein
VSPRRGLLALAVMFSAGIHAALVREHLEEMPRLGYGFIGASIAGMAIAALLVLSPDDSRLPGLAGAFCLGQILVWVLFVSVRVPAFAGTPEPVELIAVICKVAEASGVWLAGSSGARRWIASFTLKRGPTSTWSPRTRV